MKRVVEVYQVSVLSKMAPCYVDSVPLEVPDGTKLIVVNTNHKVVRDLRSKGLRVLKDLQRRGMRQVKFIWSGEIEDDILKSDFVDDISWCSLTKKFSSKPNLSAYSDFWNLSAEEAIKEMSLRFGILLRHPKIKADSKSKR